MEKEDTSVEIAFKRNRNASIGGEKDIMKKLQRMKHEVLEAPQDMTQRR